MVFLRSYLLNYQPNDPIFGNITVGLCITVLALKTTIKNRWLSPLQSSRSTCLSGHNPDAQNGPHPIRGYLLTEMAEEVPNGGPPEKYARLNSASVHHGISPIGPSRWIPHRPFTADPSSVDHGKSLNGPLRQIPHQSVMVNPSSVHRPIIVLLWSIIDRTVKPWRYSPCQLRHTGSGGCHHTSDRLIDVNSIFLGYRSIR